MDHAAVTDLLSRCLNTDEEGSQIANEAYRTLDASSRGNYTSW